MLVNRRMNYCQKITYFLQARPEFVNAFVIAVCDEISITELNKIVSELEKASNQPLPDKIKRIIEN